MQRQNCSYRLRSQLRRSTSKFSIDREMNLWYPNSLIKFRVSLRCLVRLIRSAKFLDRQCVRRSLKVSGVMLKLIHQSNAFLLLETDLRWLLRRLGPLGRALKSGLWPVMRKRVSIETALDLTDSILFNLDNHWVNEIVTVDWKKAHLNGRPFDSS